MPSQSSLPASFAAALEIHQRAVQVQMHDAEEEETNLSQHSL
jgi:hypothetical protein